MFELFLLLELASLYVWVFPDLRRLDGNVSPVMVKPTSMSMMFSLGLYGIRISFFIAALRRNRMPQTAEWIVSILSICFLFLGILFGGSLLGRYAHARGYHFCFAKAQGREAVDTFNLRGEPCPSH